MSDNGTIVLDGLIISGGGSGGGTAATTSFEPTATITSNNVQDAIEEVDAKVEAVAGDLADTEINGVAIAGKNNTCDDLGLQCTIKEGNNITKTQISESAVKVLLNFDDSVTDSAASPLTYTQPAQAEYGESLHADSPLKKSIKVKNYAEYGGYGPYAQAAKSSLNFNNNDWEIEFNRKATTPFADINCRVFGSRQDDNNFCSFTYDGRLSILRGGVATTFPSNPIPQTAGEIETIKFQFEAATHTLTAFKLIGVGVDAQIAYQESTTTAGTTYNFGYPNSQYCPIAYTPDQGGATNNALFSGFVMRDQLTPTVAGVRTTYPTITEVTKDIIACKNYFGEIYTADNTSTVSIPSGTTYTKSTAFNTAGESRGVTVDTANSRLVLPNVGYYKVEITGSSKIGTAGVVLRSALFLNGTEVSKIHAIRKFNTANDESSVSYGGIIKVTSENSEIDVRVRHDSGGAVNLTTQYANLNAVYIGDLTL